MRTRVLAAVTAILSLPPLFALFQAVGFHVRNRNNGTLVSSGIEREYLLYVPRSYEPSRPTPLVITLHGAGVWPALQMTMSRWNPIADREGFIVVYPLGRSKVWHVDGERDVRFIADLIDDLQRRYNIDRARIYANGLSNGGGMSFALSCAMSDRIAAIGMVASAQLLPWSRCTDRRAVPAIAFHGTDDRFTPYHGGITWIAPRPFPDIPKWTASFARRNRCGPHVESRVAPDVVRREYTNCAAPVVLYTIERGGHTWPGGEPLPVWFAGSTSSAVDASEVMWAFFRTTALP